MQPPAVFFVDQTKRKQQAKVSTDRLFSYGRQINLHTHKNALCHKQDSTADYIPPTCGKISHYHSLNEQFCLFVDHKDLCLKVAFYLPIFI